MRALHLIARLLFVAVLGAAAGGCATETTHEPAPRIAAPRWVVLGDLGVGPDLSALLPRPSGVGEGQRHILDLSSDAANIDTIVNRQLLRLGGARADRFILRLGPADAEGPSPPHPDTYGALVAALLATLRGRGSGIVGTIPASATASETGEPTVDAARRLRRVLEYNEQIRAAARAHGALLVEQEHIRLAAPEAAALSESAWRAAIASDALPVPRADVAAARAWLAGLDGPAQAVLRERAATAIAAGGRPDVVAKVGDSLTATPAFLAQVTAAAVEHSAYANLARTVRYFSQAPVTPIAEPYHDARPEVRRAPAAGGNDGWPSVLDALPAVSSLSRESVAAGNGWRVADVLAGDGDSPLARELVALRPAVALVMLGTNDLTHDSVEVFEGSLDRLLRAIEAARVVPVVSTIPARLDDADFARQVPRFNAAIRALAAVHHAPLIDYAGAMSHLPDLGLSADGVHPSTCPEGAGSLSAACLRYGSNLRNLLTLQALDLLYRFVLEPADGRVAGRPGDR